MRKKKSFSLITHHLSLITYLFLILAQFLKHRKIFERGYVASELDSIYFRPVLLSIALVVAPYGSEHRRPGALDNKIAAFMRAYGLPCARHHVHLDSGQRLRGRAGLGRRRTR